MTASLIDNEETPTRSRFQMRDAILPVALLGVLLATLMFANPAQWLDTAAPPLEDVAFERVELRPDTITLHIRNAAAADVTIAQLQVDGAYWAFDMTPATTLGRYQSGTVTINYPWVEGETHHLVLLTGSGIKFEHTIDVAIATPVADASAYTTYGLIGTLVGVLPLLAGMAVFPLLRAWGDAGTERLLAFTLGLLAFLAIDTVGEGLELAGEAPAGFHALGLFAGSALLAVAAVLALDGWLRAKRGSAFTLAVLIAVGIGLHNMGEGLIIGSAFALGSLVLGNALITGFALHNVTEGPAIVAPLTKGGRLSLGRYFGLAALAGVPTIFGAWLGAFSSSGLLSVIFFGLGAGAIIVVLVQVGGSMSRRGARVTRPDLLVAIAAGYLVMLATAFLTTA